ncbi:MAG: nucleotidyltransferase family protein [Candidatus Acidiferrum sp.]|jgi:NDP-sugar pyrophosphorylase family protein
MKAMILAAGLGTRLRPLTNDRPKALVELNGRTLLEITLTRLRSFGVTEAIINVHHFADMVVAYLKSKGNFDMRLEISREDDLLLDTGGGLKKAAWFFEDPAAKMDEPFLLHNVDVISGIDFNAMFQFHTERHALATLAVQARESSRQLLFDNQLQLVGRAEAHSRLATSHSPLPQSVKSSLLPLAFSGIHIISTRILPLIFETGAFSIIDTYIRLASQGEKIQAFRHDSSYWRDLGRPDDLAQAALEWQ